MKRIVDERIKETREKKSLLNERIGLECSFDAPDMSELQRLFYMRSAIDGALLELYIIMERVDLACADCDTCAQQCAQVNGAEL